MAVPSPAGAVRAEPFDALEAVLSRVRLRARRRVAWLRRLWSERGASTSPDAVTHAEVDARLDDLDNPESEAAWYSSTRELDAIGRKIARVEERLAGDRESRLSKLTRVFDLESREVDLFHACLAAALDPPLRRVYAYLQDERGLAHPTEELAARLFGHGRKGLCGPASPLRIWELLHEDPAGPGRSPSLRCDPAIRDWLEGGSGLDEILAVSAREIPSVPPLSSWPVEDAATPLLRALASPDARPVRVRIEGLEGSGRKTFAAAVAARLGLSAFSVHAAASEQPLARVHRRAERRALLHGSAPVWSGAAAVAQPWPPAPQGFPVHFLITEPGEAPSPWPGARDVVVALSPPSLDEQRRLFRSHVPACTEWTDADFGALLHKHSLLPGEMESLGSHGVQSADEASALLRALGRRRLAELAEVIECPFEWDDLVVSPWQREALSDLVHEAKDRAAFWAQPAARRLFPQGRGLVGLFTGPPGTGKTMSAQVVARALGLDLFRVDLSGVVSKYVGETSKNLQRILARAATMDIVLLFDEADALFGRRTEIKDAHDRFANTDTNYLLQAIESYPGVALLSSNKKGNIDAAFLRRLRYVLEFPPPDAAQRLAIWRRLVGELAGPPALAALDPSLERLAQGLDLSGAQIKYAVLAALFLSRRDDAPLGKNHLMRGVDRELAKDGRSLGKRDRERLLAHGP